MRILVYTDKYLPNNNKTKDIDKASLISLDVQVSSHFLVE